MTDLARAIELYPEHAGTFGERGETYRLMGNTTKQSTT